MAIILPLSFILLLLIKVPIAFALGLTGFLALYLSGNPMSTIPRQIFQGMNSFALMAIPFFLLAGNLMNAAKITDKIIGVTNALIGNVRGGMGHINILASIFFAGISGAAVSDTAAIGSMLIPAMEKSGYSRPYATAITAASSIIGPTIPPSIPMIIYGAIMNVSIAGMFAAGLLPGALMGLLMMIMNHFISTRRGYDIKNVAPSEITYFHSLRKALFEGILALLMPFIILGGILGGVFTPTEAAAVSAGYAVFIGLFILKTLSLKKLWEVLKSTIYMTGVAMLLVSTGRIISWYLTIEMIPNAVARQVLHIAQNDIAFLFVTALFLLFVGTFMDLTASIIILAPILAPIAMRFGIAPFHFGLTMVLALNIGLNTPPVGAVLFVASSVAKERMENIIKEIWPFYICQIITLILVIFWSPLTMYIPRLLGYAR